MVFAALCVLLGVVGIFVPGMPTTVFILLAAWVAARSSPRLHRWLMGHRLFGPMIVNWQNGGTVSRRVKWTATLSMGLSSLTIAWFVRPLWLMLSVFALMAAVLGWLWLRPEP
ncbi:MAG: YbaN family protein [Pseudomonadota bacterium]